MPPTFSADDTIGALIAALLRYEARPVFIAGPNPRVYLVPTTDPDADDNAPPAFLQHQAE